MKQSPPNATETRPLARSQPSSGVNEPRHWLSLKNWGHLLTGIWVVAAATTTALDLGVVQWLERQTQTFFFEIRGPVAPPAEIVVLAIDETSLSQGEFYHSDPEKFSELEPIQTWPWKRTAYATAIEKLLAAGARSVTLDIIFASSSSYGQADDQRLAQALQRHPQQVVLASQFADLDTPQGRITQLIQPLPEFSETALTGSINFLIEPDGRIHRFGEQFLEQMMQDSPEQATAFEDLAGELPTLAEATLQAAQIQPQAEGEHLFFFGPEQTFTHIPFWYVLDPTTWEQYLNKGEYFRDKIVLIGSTATVHQDFHSAPFSRSWLYPQPLAGVEIHANAIATLMTDRAIAPAISSAPLRGLAVLLGLTLAGWLISRPRQLLARSVWAAGLVIVWSGIGYSTFTFEQIILPTAVPVGAIALSGLSQLLVGTVREQQRKQQLRNTLRRYPTSPVVQEIISQQDDLQDLLREREKALYGNVLGQRYRIIKVLGSGGFSETYVAEDLQRPTHPTCVVKQIKLNNTHPDSLKLARRLFTTEAEALERLGQHDRIPQLMAYFEENQEFYLIQEFILGSSLGNELLPRRKIPEANAIAILYELLKILKFIHSQGVIHRDVKPANIIRRKKDDALVLIDFGIARKISTQLAETDPNTRFTVGIGTPGYMPNEQAAGMPHFSSDIYAVGMIGIEALTGRAPQMMERDLGTGKLCWEDETTPVSPELAQVLNKMVQYDHRRRYQTAQEVLTELEQLPNFSTILLLKAIATGTVTATVPLENIPETLAETSNLDADSDTLIWPEGWSDN